MFLKDSEIFYESLLLCIARMLVCVCVCVWVWVGGWEGWCMRARARALRIISRDKILRFKITFIIII